MENQAPLQTRFYSFGAFCLDVHRLLLLSKEGKALPLAPRSIRTLSLLVQNPGVDLTKEYVMDQIWPDTAVEENNLTVIISALRKTLGEDPEQHQYIVTIPGKGYRFVADVIENAEPPAKAAALGTATTVLIESRKPADAVPLPKPPRSRTRILACGAAAVVLISALFAYLAMKGRTAAANTTHTLAVLPFQSDGFGSDDEYLALGMADALVARLRNIRHLLVRPTEDALAYRNSTYDPRDAGRALNVGTLVLGSVHKSDANVDVNVKLVRTSDAAVLWSAEFKGEINDLLSIQNRMANQIASAVTLTPKPEQKEKGSVNYSQNPEAYQLYLHGEYFLTHKLHSSGEYTLDKAVEYFNLAIEKDQHFALAYAGLADAYNKLSWYLPPDQSFAKAEAAAKKALALDPNLAAAYRSLAIAMRVYEWDFGGADAAFRRSIELNPNDSTTYRWHAEELLMMGRNQEAAEEWRRAQQLDPFSTLPDTLGLLYFYSRDYRDAFLEMQGKQDVDPDVFWYLAWIYNFHLPDLGIAAPQHAPSPAPANHVLTNCELSYANVVRANRENITSCIKSLEKDGFTPYISPYDIALLYIAKRDKKSAFYWLERARKAHSFELCYVKVDPRLDDLRADARFNNLLEKMGLNR
ncbi:MAG: winged helix-turn-helix domain-containing tetratricopeptide repeat protein [Candidatus Sulfotelmatobacter sp.]